jgi:tetratricopeptide (TPR) repeat protein
MSASGKLFMGGGALLFAALCVLVLRLPPSQPTALEARPPVATPTAAPKAAPPVEKIPHSPMTQEELPTTDGEISLSNITGSVVSAEEMLGRRPKDPVAHAHLVGLLIVRGQILGRIADYERAAELGEQAVKRVPRDPRSFLARAQARGTFHEFQDALTDLEQAERLAHEVHEEELLPLIKERRAGMLRGLGRLDEAAAIYAAFSSERKNIGRLTAEASLLAEQGELARAEAMFIEAQRHHPDVSPFPIAWLYLQEGLMWEAQGNLARAFELYSAAHERFPAYAAVRSHLAGAFAARARRERALELLRPLVESSDDPEYAGQLSALLKEAGATEEAERLRGVAQKRYEALLKLHPTAYAAHAARFYLGAGGDAKAAAKWAEHNLAARKTAEGYSLAVEATAAAGLGERACSLADEMARLKVVTAQMHVMAARAYQTCGKPQRADEELAKVK